jgi:hypothetical protein
LRRLQGRHLRLRCGLRLLGLGGRDWMSASLAVIAVSAASFAWRARLHLLLGCSRSLGSGLVQGGLILLALLGLDLPGDVLGDGLVAQGAEVAGDVRMGLERLTARRLEQAHATALL